MAYNWLCNHFPLWPEYSGNLAYPVRSPRTYIYGCMGAFDTLPRWTGEYGSSRIRLLNFLIRQAEAELAAE